MMYVINPNNGAVSTHSANPSHIVEHEGVLYGSVNDTLVSFDGPTTGGHVKTGRVEYDSDRLSNIREVAVNYESTEPLTVDIIYGDAPFGPYSTVMSDRRVKTSRAESAYARTPSVTISWTTDEVKIERATIYTTPHPRRRS